MARKTFHVPVGEKDHLVEVDWSRWSSAGEIKVNGKVIKAWGSGWWLPREVEFEIGNEKMTLVPKGFMWENWVLIIKGNKIE